MLLDFVMVYNYYYIVISYIYTHLQKNPIAHPIAHPIAQACVIGFAKCMETNVHTPGGIVVDTPRGFLFMPLGVFCSYPWGFFVDTPGGFLLIPLGVFCLYP